MAMIDKGTILVKNGKIINKEKTGAGREVEIENGELVLNFWNFNITVGTKEFTKGYLELCDWYEEMCEEINTKFPYTDEDLMGDKEPFRKNYERGVSLAKEFNFRKELLTDDQAKYCKDLGIKTYVNLAELTTEHFEYHEKDDEGNLMYFDENETQPFLSKEKLYNKYAPQTHEFGNLVLTTKRLDTCSNIYATSFTLGGDKYVVIQGYDVSNDYFHTKENGEPVRKYLNNKCLRKGNKLPKGYFTYGDSK